jgi:flavin-dependent dehydrogenase
MSQSLTTQVLIIGGGPGGATTAALLARQGFDVVLLEQQAFPRYHIGESLQPSCLRILDELGIRQQVEQMGFIRKEGSIFDWGGQTWSISFQDSSELPYAFQVVRSEFDQLLLSHAASEGVAVHEEAEVKEIDFSDGRPRSARFVDATGREGRCAFEVLVDASGRTGMLATRYLRTRRFHEAFRNVALWGYWHGTDPPPEGPKGATASCSFQDGWLWAIPLSVETLSLGAVMHKSRLKALRERLSLEEIYETAVQSNALVRNMATPGERVGPLRAETDYSYAASEFSGSGYYLVGDAACFLDPLLSTGLHLATFSGLVAAASISSTLREEVDENDAASFFNASYRRAYVRMLVVVSAFYQMHAGREEYFREAQRLTAGDYSDSDLVKAFINVVSGVEDLKDAGKVSPGDLLDSMVSLYAEHHGFVREMKSGGSLSLAEIKKGMARTQVVEDVQVEFSLTPETAVNGLFVRTGSRLGLERAAL